MAQPGRVRVLVDIDLGKRRAPTARSGIDSEMVPPIIVEEHGDVIFFRSVEGMEKYLEPLDVRNLEYSAFDSVGTALNLEVTMQRRRIFGSLLSRTEEKVLVRKGEGKADGLRRVLFSYIRKFDEGPDLHEDSRLDALVSRALELAGYTD